MPYKKIKYHGRLAILLLQLLLLPFSATAEIYTWTDEHGKTHYSDTKPEDTPAETLPGSKKDEEPIASQPKPDSEYFKGKLLEQQYKEDSESTSRSQNTTRSSEASSLEYPVASTEFVDVRFTDKRNLLTQDVIAHSTGQIHIMASIYNDLFKIFDDGDPFRETVTITVMTPSDVEQFRWQNNLKQGSYRSHFLSNYRQAIVILDEDYNRESARRSIIHEASHVIFGVKPVGFPPWINEGLAQLFEDIQGNMNSYHIAPSGSRMNDAQNCLSNIAEPVKALQDLLEYTFKYFHTNNESCNYDLSWSFVAYMFLIPEYQKLLADVYHSYWSQEPGAPDALEVIDNFFGGDSSRFYQGWQTWVTHTSNQ